MKLTGQRKHLLAASATLTFAGLIAASVAVLAPGGAADVDGHDQRPGQLQASGEVTFTTAGVLEEPVPVPAAPVIMRPYREPGITTSSVGEHPNVLVSPIQTATVVIEPAHELRLSVPDNTPAACERFRSLVANGREWDPEVVLAIAWRESNCNERLVSPTNDWGLLQLNATCWAGQANDGLSDVPSLPEGIQPVDLRCDGIHRSKPAAQWCYLAKEAVYDSGELPPSPCDAWLDPTVNVATAYELWLVQGWRPWCFNETSRASTACQAARASL